MTTNVDVLYRYEQNPGESAVGALAKVHKVYGIRHVRMDEKEQTVRVEFDASRLDRETVQKLLRRAGIAIVEQVSLLPTQPAPERVLPPPAAAPAK